MFPLHPDDQWEVETRALNAGTWCAEFATYTDALIAHGLDHPDDLDDEFEMRAAEQEGREPNFNREKPKPSMPTPMYWPTLGGDDGIPF